LRKKKENEIPSHSSASFRSERKKGGKPGRLSSRSSGRLLGSRRKEKEKDHSLPHALLTPKSSARGRRREEEEGIGSELPVYGWRKGKERGIAPLHIPRRGGGRVRSSSFLWNTTVKKKKRSSTG